MKSSGLTIFWIYVITILVVIDFGKLAISGTKSPSASSLLSSDEFDDYSHADYASVNQKTFPNGARGEETLKDFSPEIQSRKRNTSSIMLEAISSEYNGKESSPENFNNRNLQQSSQIIESEKNTEQMKRKNPYAKYHRRKNHYKKKFLENQPKKSPITATVIDGLNFQVVDEQSISGLQQTQEIAKTSMLPRKRPQNRKKKNRKTVDKHDPENPTVTDRQDRRTRKKGHIRRKKFSPKTSAKRDDEKLVSTILDEPKPKTHDEISQESHKNEKNSVNRYDFENQLVLYSDKYDTATEEDILDNVNNTPRQREIVEMNRKTKSPREKNRRRGKTFRQRMEQPADTVNESEMKKEKRKFLQAKRGEKRQRKKLERMQRKKSRLQLNNSSQETEKRKMKNSTSLVNPSSEIAVTIGPITSATITTTITLPPTQSVAGLATSLMKNSKNVNKMQSHIDSGIILNGRTNFGTNAFMAPPSIDYFVEKSTNYVESNDTLPSIGGIGVSVETPSPMILVGGNDVVFITSAEDENSMRHADVNPPDILNYKNSNLAHRIKDTVDFSSSTEGENINDDDEEDDDDASDSGDIESNEHAGHINRQPQENVDRHNGGDLSCLKDDFTPAPVVQHAEIKYLRNEMKGIENAFLEVEYICHRGYKLILNKKKDVRGNYDDNSSGKDNRSSVYCKNGRWLGVPPQCIRQKDFHQLNETVGSRMVEGDKITASSSISLCRNPERCEQLCYVSQHGHEKCACHKGFQMKNYRCVDINECSENISVCEFGCVNTVGSYQCKCPNGLRVGDANSCIDINECLLRNGHGPCQDACINTWGSYKCSCDSLSGSHLSSDGHSCEDLDECTINNGGCSHTCINTMGRAVCFCPDGWTLDKDWKTCVDIDECSDLKYNDSNLLCEFGCINTPGSYTCLIDMGADQPIEDNLLECSDGYFKNSITNDCTDINECANDNGGCYHYCVNTIGSYHCSCRTGYVFASDKYTCIVPNTTSDISCPPLFPPKHGYLECSRPIASDIEMQPNDIDGNGNEQQTHRRITNRPGSQCILRCPPAFRINGIFSKQCSTSGKWIGDDNGTCIRYPKPKLICPSNIVVETPPNETMAKLTIPRPKTDVNFERDVITTPEWAKNIEVALEIGIKNITYTAVNPVSKLSVQCSFQIKVLDGEAPQVKFCPVTKKYSIAKQHDSIKIAWNEPIFVDNVNVTEISRTNNPGNSFGLGSHQIVYVAHDQAGYVARCVFKLFVNVPYQTTLTHPLPIYHMFY